MCVNQRTISTQRKRERDYYQFYFRVTKLLRAVYVRVQLRFTDPATYEQFDLLFIPIIRSSTFKVKFINMIINLTVTLARIFFRPNNAFFPEFKDSRTSRIMRKVRDDPFEFLFRSISIPSDTLYANIYSSGLQTTPSAGTFPLWTFFSHKTVLRETVSALGRPFCRRIIILFLLDDSLSTISAGISGN